MYIICTVYETSWWYYTARVLTKEARFWSLRSKQTYLINGISHLSQIYRSSWSMGNNVDNNCCHDHKLIIHIQKTACGEKKKGVSRIVRWICIYARAQKKQNQTIPINYAHAPRRGIFLRHRQKTIPALILITG